ncbi:DUF3347 domain-containing protein [Flavobacterium sp.]|uniref:DUF3347 domain-containing protein n=1 Tax=unclassified Flavobacterium TaxID=196869 RepID=UPI0025C3BB2E|nr:DUF3347 domain-containing protein [Flavobacterium sp.]
MFVETLAKRDKEQLKAVFDNYFLLKDALVKTDGKAAASASKELLTAISSVKMETLKTEEHMVWMKVSKDMSQQANSISATQDIKKHREFFNPLSKNMYTLIKTSEAVYYQYCPMQKTNWLSKENTIKNPYYGSQMLGCGKTVEIIK